MDFNTLIFVGFFAAATALNYLFPRVARPWFLLLASYVFYLYKPENARLVFVLITLTLVTYLCGLVIEASHKPAVRRAFLLLGILAGCGFLFFFKYFEFFTGKALDLMAPLGLSYFTFQSMGYVIDVYQKVCPAQKNPVKYALFVSFFPCIFTGPIERAEHLMPQLENPRPFNYSRMAGGAFRMLWGYFKKMVVADRAAVLVERVILEDPAAHVADEPVDCGGQGPEDLNDELIARNGGNLVVELLVQLSPHLRRAGGHLPHQAVQPVHLAVGDPVHRQQRRLQLQPRAQLGQLVVVDLLEQNEHVKGILQIALDVAADEIARPLAAHQKAHVLQQPDGLPHGIAADAQLFGQLPLGGQGLAQGELAIPEGVLQIGQYVLVGFLLFRHMLSLPFQTISVDLSDCNYYTTSVNKL